MTEQLSDEYDGAWKEAIETYFEECLAFFFPQAHADIDWARGYKFLDKEFQKIVPEAELGKRTADKLSQVWRKGGSEVWVLIHLEVQSQHETDFAKRMYTYNYRLFDRYDRQVASLAILGDASPKWRPKQYRYNLWGSEAGLKFPTVKLLDYKVEQEWARLEQSRNPFAVVVMAHLHTQATRHQPDDRYALKWQLTRRLYEQGYTRRDILLLFRFIDWLMALPPALKYKFEETLIKYEEAQNMPYITSIEQIGIEKGIEKGIEQGIEQGRLQTLRQSVLQVLKIRFGDLLPAIIEAIDQLDDITRLEMLLEKAVLVASLADLEQALAKSTPDEPDNTTPTSNTTA